jgi:hypothetical protein
VLGIVRRSRLKTSRSRPGSTLASYTVRGRTTSTSSIPTLISDGEASYSLGSVAWNPTLPPVDRTIRISTWPMRSGRTAMMRRCPVTSFPG